jgi:type I restriction enzyme M protein
VDKVTESFVDFVSDSCRGRLQGRELVQFIACMVAWECLGNKLPEDLRPSSKAVLPLSVGSLRKTWIEISNRESLGEGRFAFAAADRFPYQLLSDDLLARISLHTRMTIAVLEADDKVELATWIVDSYHGATPGDELLLPKEVAELLLDVLGVAKDESVLCPEPNIAWAAMTAMQRGARPLVVGRELPVVVSTFSAIAGHPFDYSQMNPYEPGASDFYRTARPKYAVVSPPFGARSESHTELGYLFSKFNARTSEALGVELALRTGESRSAVIVPNSFLFKSGPEMDLRKHLVKRGLLEAVIGFPQGLLSNTGLPFSALILSKDQQRHATKFCKVDEREHVDGRGKLRSRRRRLVGGSDLVRLLARPAAPKCGLFEQAQLQNQDFVLTPERYLDKRPSFFERKENECVALGDLVDVVKPQLISDLKKGDGIIVREVSPGELPQFSFLETATRERKVDRAELSIRASQVIRTGDILLSTKGTIGKVGIARLEPNRPPVLPSLSSVILRMKPSTRECDERFLVMYLRSPAVQTLLNTIAVGATIRNIPLGELRALPIWLPSRESQEAFVRVFDKQAELERRAAEIAAEQQEVAQSLWREAGLEAENMGPSTA